MDADTGCNVTVHGEGAGVGLGVGLGVGAGSPDADSWLIETATSATVMTPLRAAPELRETVNDRVALPLPERGDTVIQLTLLAAVHEQPPAEASAMLPAPPAPEK